VEGTLADLIGVLSDQLLRLLIVPNALQLSGDLLQPSVKLLGAICNLG
jgi:hypothetical protein